MLTLTPGCSCDVCAEEYSTHRPPHSIPCGTYVLSVVFIFYYTPCSSIGHVLCANCCLNIAEKTSPRSPACPFCRKPFTSDSTRLIRMDFTTSGFLSLVGSSKARPDVRRLEEKVARVAAKKCSVKEISSLYTELDSWLRSEKDEQVRPLTKEEFAP